MSPRRRDRAPLPRHPRVLVAPNAFKGSCSARVAGAAIARGVLEVWPDARPVILPMADGGDGFLAALVTTSQGAVTRHRVPGPLGASRLAALGWLGGPGPRTAVIELARACGLAGIGTPTPATSLAAGTEGAGALIRAALDRGAARILVGVGGSASTDGGAGLLRALGLRCLDAHGRPLPPGGGALAALARVDRTGLDPRLGRVAIAVAADVRSPLLGPRGAAAVYGPQKGADPLAVRRLEAGLARWAQLLGGRGGLRPATPGAGAAGGTAFGLAAGLGAQIASGADVVAEAVGLDRRLRSADWVLTGEGRLDLPTLVGKAPGLVAERAVRFGVPCVVLAGSLDPRAERWLARRGVAVLALGDGPRALDAAVRTTAGDLRRAAARACRLWGASPAGSGR